MAVEAEQLLDPDGDLGSALGLVVDRYLRPGRRRKMRGRFDIRPALERPRQQRAKRAAKKTIQGKR